MADLRDSGERGPRLPRPAVAVACLLAAALSVAGCAGCGSDGPTGTVTVFASSSVRAQLTAVAKRFESADPGVKVTLTFGASRALFARTRPGRVSGPPGADVFVTSDNSVIHDLSGGSGAGDSESSGDPTNAAIFVEDVLHIVTLPGNPKHLTALGDLAKPSLRVVLGRPGTPIGGGARQVLAKAGVTVAHPVGANDAAAVVAAIAGRRADAGIVDGGAAQAAGNGVTTIDIPAALNVLSSYYAAQPVDAPHRKLGLTFMTFLFSPDAQKILTDGGLQAIPCAGPIAKICAPSFDG